MANELELQKEELFSVIEDNKISEKERLEKVTNSIKLLKNKGVKLDFFRSNSTKPNITPLMLACGENHPEVVEVLIKAGVDVNQKDGQNFTAIIDAVNSDSLACLNLLIDEKADLNVVTTRGRTALSYAIESNKKHCIDRLIEAGVDVKKDMSSMLNAILKDDEEMVKRLIDLGIDINEKDSLGETPLMSTITHKKNNIMKLLLQQDNIDLEVKNKNNYTALAMAEMAKDEEAIGAIKEVRAKKMKPSVNLPSFGEVVIGKLSTAFSLFSTKDNDNNSSPRPPTNLSTDQSTYYDIELGETTPLKAVRIKRKNNK